MSFWRGGERCWTSRASRSISGPAPSNPAFRLADNIGISGTVVTDAAPMEILDTLALATQCEVAVVDLKEGDAWWMSRLLPPARRPFAAVSCYSPA
ncbi:hypothetical protein [Methylomonas sp. CM2]|uniref:hypothetical protein n=1 Tax=Methylomonas sp. CM2 TaxID=3417647 RepID=UPI003CF3A056